MNDSNVGPFKNFRVLWFPYSNPAALWTTVAWLLFRAACSAVALAFDDVKSGGDAVRSFGHNIGLVLTSFSFRELDGPATAFWMLLGVAILLWATFGLAAARALAARLTRDEYIGYRESLTFGFREAPAALRYPLLLAGVIGFLVLLNALLGATMQIPVVGPIFTVLLPFAYVITLAILFVTLTGVAGLGLVTAAIAVERRGTMDAWGKALGYVYARPVQYIIYIVVTKVFAIDIVWRFTVEEELLRKWTTSSLAPLFASESFERMMGGAGDPKGLEIFGRWVERGTAWSVEAFFFGVVLSLLVCAFCCIFLILRRDVDGIDITEIDLELRGEPEPEVIRPAPTSSPVPDAPEGADTDANPDPDGEGKTDGEG